MATGAFCLVCFVLVSLVGSRIAMMMMVSVSLRKIHSRLDEAFLDSELFALSL